MNSFNLKIITVIISLLSIQRYTLPEIYCFTPIIPLVLFIFSYNWKSDETFRSIMIVLSLVTITDNGGELFSETNSILRNLIYIISLLYLISLNTKIRVEKLFIWFAWITSLLITSFLFTIDNVTIYQTVYDDLFILFLILFVFCSKIELNLSKFDIQKIINSLFVISATIIIFEIVNYLLYFDSTKGYLNYQSTKSIVTFSFLILICYRNVFLSIISFICTSFVLVFYVTRMIFISFIFVIFLFVLRRLVVGKKINYRILILLVLLIMPFYLVSFLGTDLNEIASGYKLSAMILTVVDSSSIEQLFYSLDPVRYTEFVVFKSRSWFEIIFGSGLGATYTDKFGVFGFVGDNKWAFSDFEIENRIYFNFHDVWSDQGYRIGMIPILALMYYLFQSMGKNKESAALSMIIFVLTFCAFWSKSGVLLIFLLLFFLRISNTQNN